MSGDFCGSLARGAGLPLRWLVGALWGAVAGAVGWPAPLGWLLGAGLLAGLWGVPVGFPVVWR